MTDEELDGFFFETLEKIKSEYEDCKSFYREKNDEAYSEIIDDYNYITDGLERILEGEHSLDALAENDEETIDMVYEAVADYAGNFVISPENESEQYSKNMEEYEKIEEILDLFIDEDYEEEQDDE